MITTAAKATQSSRRWWAPVAAGLLITAALLLRVVVLGRGYFVEDDVALIGNAFATELTPDFLFSFYDNQLMPAGLAVVWGLTRLAPYNWELAAGLLLVVQALACVAMYRLTRLLFDSPLAAVVLTGLYAFVPLTVPALGWWAAGLNAIPLQLAIPMALMAHVRYVRTGSARHAAVAAAWVVFGLAFFIKAVFIPPLLLALTLAFLDRATLRRHWRGWAAYAVVLAAYVIVYLLRRHTSTGLGADVPLESIGVPLALTMVGITFPAGLAGGLLAFGGWQVLPVVGGRADPGLLVVGLSWLIIVVLVVVSCSYRRHAWRAWAVILSWLLVADLVPTLLARGRSFTEGYVSGLDTHYVADVVPIWVICAGLAFLPLRGEQDALRRPAPGPRLRLAGATAVAVVLVASTVSALAYAATIRSHEGRAYFDRARAELAAMPVDAEIYAGQVPSDIAVGWLGNSILTTRVLAPLAPPERAARMSWPAPTSHPLVFDDTGRLVPPRIKGYFAGAPKGAFCLPMDRGAIWQPWFSLGGHEAVTALAFTADRPTQITAELGGQRLHLTLPRQTESRLFLFAFPASGTGLRISVADGAGFCLQGIALGRAVPASAP